MIRSSRARIKPFQMKRRGGDPAQPLLKGLASKGCDPRQHSAHHSIWAEILVALEWLRDARTGCGICALAGKYRDLLLCARQWQRPGFHVLGVARFCRSLVHLNAAGHAMMPSRVILVTRICKYSLEVPRNPARCNADGLRFEVIVPSVWPFLWLQMTRHCHQRVNRTCVARELETGVRVLAARGKRWKAMFGEVVVFASSSESRREWPRCRSWHMVNARTSTIARI